MAPGLPVGGFIAIVFVILLLNVGGVFGYHKFLEKNPDKTVAPKLAPELLAPLRYVSRAETGSGGGNLRPMSGTVGNIGANGGEEGGTAAAANNTIA